MSTRDKVYAVAAGIGFILAGPVFVAIFYWVVYP